MRTTLTLRERIAVELERKTVGSSVYWDEEQLHAWCFDDQFGAKYYAASLQVADHLLAVFDVKEKYDETDDAESERQSRPVQP